MPLDYTDAWYDAFTGEGVEPIYLVDISGYLYWLTWATRPFAPGGIIKLDQALRIDTGLELNQVRDPYTSNALKLLTGGGIGPISELIDPYSNQIRVSDVTLEVSDPELQVSLLGGTIVNAVVTIRLAAPGLGIEDALPLFYGFIDRHRFARIKTSNNPPRWEQRYQLTLVSGSWAWHKNLDVYIGQNDVFPGTQADYKGQAIPIIVGRAVGLECPAVRGEAAGSIAVQVESGDTEVILTEYGAPFPEAGTITMGSESGVTYTGRTVLNTGDDVSYLKLTGLGRGSPATQLVGSAVTLTSVNYDFLAAYKVGAVLNVRDDDVLTTAYTEITDATIGQDTTILRFSSAPTGTIRGDFEGNNLSALSSIPNGDLETGSVTPWTSVSGGVLALETTSTTGPDPYEGTYALSVQGGVLTNGGGYNDFPTKIGQAYTLFWVSQDENAAATGNLLSGGSLTVASLPGWTISTNTGAIARIEPANVLSGPYVFFDPFLRFIGSEIGPGPASWTITFYQDVATGIGTDYELSLQYRIQNFESVLLGIRHYARCTITLMAGTTADPDSDMIHILNGSSPLGSYTQQFTASDTTTRITIQISGTNAGQTVPQSAYADIIWIGLIAVTAASRSQTTIRVGTADDDDAYLARSLPQFQQWIRQSATFVALTQTTRFTFLSQYNNGVVVTKSYLDQVQVAASGRNPVDVIEYIITNFVPALDIDTDSFNAARLARRLWLFGGVLGPPGDSKRLLDELAEQADLWRYESAEGKCVLVARSESADSIHAFQQNSPSADQAFLDDEIIIEQEHHDRLATEIYVYYGLRTGASRTNIQGYQGVVFATPETSTLGDGRLEARCFAAQQATGSTQRLTKLAYAIQDQQTALYWLEQLIYQHTSLSYNVSWRSRLPAARFQRGDVVKLSHDAFAFASGAIFAVILGKTASPATGEVAFTGRMLRRIFEPLFQLDFEWPTPADPGETLFTLNWETGSVIAPDDELWTLDFEWPSPLSSGTSQWSIDFESGDPT